MKLYKRKHKHKKKGKNMTFEFFDDEVGYALKKTVSPEAQAKIMARLGRATMRIV